MDLPVNEGPIAAQRSRNLVMLGTLRASIVKRAELLASLITTSRNLVEAASLEPAGALFLLATSLRGWSGETTLPPAAFAEMTGLVLAFPPDAFAACELLEGGAALELLGGGAALELLEAESRLRLPRGAAFEPEGD